MPYKKRGKYYYRKGRRYTLKQVQVIHINKIFRKRKKGK